MFRILVLAMFLAISSAFMTPAVPSKMLQSKVQQPAIFASEATRDPETGVSADWDGIWGFDRQKEIFLAWDPESPRTYTNFSPFERNLDGAKCDSNGCFPGESRGYQPPNRPDVNWQIMQEEKVKLDELKQHPKWGLSGKPGCYSLKWQEKLGAPP